MISFGKFGYRKTPGTCHRQHTLVETEDVIRIAMRKGINQYILVLGRSVF